MRYLALILSFLMVSGCSTYSYSGRPVTVPKIETMPVWRTEGPVTVGVDPYIQTDRQKEVFDDDLEKAGVLPIYLSVRNSGDRKLSLRPSDIVLEYPGGYTISPVQRDTVLRMLGRLSPPTRVERGEDAAVLFYSLFPLLPFTIPAYIANQRATAARLADYDNKEFQDTHGFLFFMPPSSGVAALKGKLVLRFVDEADGSSFVVRVPVSEQ